MKHDDRDLIATLATMAATLAIGCGADDGFGDPADLGDGSRPRVEQVQLTRLALTSSDAPTMLHPLRLDVELDVAGEAFDTDVLVGLRARDGELGCVLGALPAVQAEPGASQLRVGAEFFVSAECAPMIGRDDVELFAAFDPWGDTEVEREGTAVDEPTRLYDIVRGSMLDTEGCQDCRVATALLDSPGPDAQLRQVSLDSSVAVLSLPASADQQQLPGVDTPHFQISTAMRVTGLPRGEAAREGETFMRYRIRPLAGAPGTDELGAAALGWAPLLERSRDAAGQVRYDDQVVLDPRGQTAVQRASALYISDDVAARMGAGDWHAVEEFELETCVGTSYAQAVYQGETSPRDNDCAVLPVVVVREHVGPTGEKGIAAGDALAGGANARSAEVWSTSWSTSNEFLNTTYDSGISFETWLDINASDTASTTYGGRSVDEAGSWFEAGAYSAAEVFNNDVTLLDAFVTLIGYDSGGGEVELKVEAMGMDIVDAVSIDSQTGVTLTLAQILNIAGASTTTTWADEITLYGYSFDDGCGTVSAGIFLDGEIGIDNQETNVNVQSGGGAVSVTGTITPMASVSAVSKAEAAYEGFLSINVALSITLEILSISFPFTASVTYDWGTPSALTFQETASLALSTLSGSIDFAFNYEYWCWDWDDWSCNGSHNHNLLSWDGIEDSWTLFDWSQSLYFGSGSDDFCGTYDGDTISLRTHHDTYVRANASPQGYIVNQSSSEGVWERFLVQCQADGKVALKTAHNRWIQPHPAGGGWVVRQQSSVGPWEKLTPVYQSDGKWAFLTAHGRYLQANDDGSVKQQTYVGTWEKFTVGL